LKNEFQKPKKLKESPIKSPSIPLFQRGKLTSPPFGRWPERASGPEGKGRQGGIFKALKYYNPCYYCEQKS
jgi:hypothetical protein